MPDVIECRMVLCLKAGNLRILSQRDKPISYQLVGEVTAHQGLRVAGLRGWSATLGLRHCPDSYGRLQSRIFRNGRKPDGATPRERRRPSGCKVLSVEKNEYRLIAVILTLSSEEALANSVPAAAVIRRGQALFGITGHKGHVGGSESRL